MEEREEIRQIKLAQKDKYELKHSGGYERIYPSEDQKLQERYDFLIAASKEVYGE